ncbi:hypothetical protein LCGC14_1126790, partial [marine sediment metagenome]
MTEGTGNKGDTPQSNSEANPPESQEASVTREQANQMVQEALTKAGRDAKAQSDGWEALKTAQTTFDSERTASQREREAAEDAAVTKDPDAFAALTKKREAAKKDSDAETLREQNKTLVARNAELEDLAKGTEREQNAATVAAEKNVDPAK